jgi:uncharacterized protein
MAPRTVRLFIAPQVFAVVLAIESAAVSPVAVRHSENVEMNQQQESGPSFDCATATLSVDKFVCRDRGLASLDRRLADAFAKALQNWTAESIRTEAKEVQRRWIVSRSDCTKSANVRACLEARYRRRLIEVQITSGQLSVPEPVGYICSGQNEPFTVTFYNQTEPKSAAITFGDRQVIAVAVEGGSGTRYAATDVEFREHRGEAAVTWAGVSFTCKPA